MFARFLSSTNQRNFSLYEAGNAEKIFTVNENQTTIKKTESRSSTNTAEITEITELWSIKTSMLSFIIEKKDGFVYYGNLTTQICIYMIRDNN